MISVGTDAACDWQIRAAFVPPRAFSVLVVGGRAFVRSGPEPGLLVDGKPVDDNWNPLPEQARIDVGLARFEIVTGYADAIADGPLLELTQPRVRTESPQTESSHAFPVTPGRQAAVVPRRATQQGPSRTKSRKKRLMDTQEYAPMPGSRGVRVVGAPLVTPAAQGARPTQVRNSTIELNFDDLDYVGTLPHAPGHADRYGDHTVAPSLLESDEITRVTSRARGVRYAMAGMLFVSAYGAWLYLLDYL